MTVLNAIVDVDTFKRPWSMEPFARRGLGEVYLRALCKPAFRILMGLQGSPIAPQSPTPNSTRMSTCSSSRTGDRAFLKIVRGLERTAVKRDLYRAVLGSKRYPVQVVWGTRDPALKVGTYGEAARRAADVDAIRRLPRQALCSRRTRLPRFAHLVAAITPD